MFDEEERIYDKISAPSSSLSSLQARVSGIEPRLTTITFTSALDARHNFLDYSSSFFRVRKCTVDCCMEYNI